MEGTFNLTSTASSIQYNLVDKLSPSPPAYTQRSAHPTRNWQILKIQHPQLLSPTQKRPAKARINTKRRQRAQKPTLHPRDEDSFNQKADSSASTSISASTHRTHPPLSRSCRVERDRDSGREIKPTLVTNQQLVQRPATSPSNSLGGSIIDASRRAGGFEMEGGRGEAK